MQRYAMELDKLFDEVGSYRNSDDYLKLLNFTKRFPYYAPYNAMLLHIQKPGSHYVTNATTWRNKFGRYIRPGARPLVILKPFGPVEFVFDLSDTEGIEPFPEALINPFKVEGVINGKKFHDLVKWMKTDGIAYTETDRGSDSAGSIQLSNGNRTVTLRIGKKLYSINVLYDMVVNANHPKTTKFATMLHELGHLYCGHLPGAKKYWGERENISEQIQEFEAESVCWLVCERLGINNPSAEYLSGYLTENNEIPNISIESVLKAAGTIESLMNESKKLREELVCSSSKIEEQKPAQELLF